MPNLILVHQKTKQAIEDYHYIQQEIGKRQADIQTYIVDTKELQWALADKVAQNPTLTISPMPIKKFQAPRGPVLQGYEWPKGEQYQRMRDIGVSVPDWQVIGPDVDLDPEFWGPYVVVKPELGRRGAEVRIKRTERIKYRPVSDFAENHPGSKAPLLAQRFVYTGRWPINYRVVTVFGKTLICWRCEVDHSFPPLEERYAFSGGGITIVSNKKSSHYTLAYDEDVIDLAERAHAAFPDQPLLGSDIVRDADTGEIFVLEASPRGDTWYMSSDTGHEIQEANGVDFMNQFNALEIVIDELVKKTLEAAR